MAHEASSDRPAPGSIVVGIDGSEGAAQALAWATAQARLERRALTLVHAVDIRVTQWSGETAFDVSTVLSQMNDEARAALAAARESVGADLVVQTVLRQGDPRLLLRDLSRTATMVVVGSRGRGPVKSLLLGSVSVGVSQHAACPVVVVRPAETGPADAAPTLVEAPIVVGVRTDRSPSHALEFAFRQASLHSAPVTVLHGRWDELYGYSGPPPVANRTGADLPEPPSVESVLADLRAKFPDVAVLTLQATGLPDRCLLRTAEERGASLVVVGSDHPSVAATLLEGDVARDVTEHAHGPVAVVPES